MADQRPALRFRLPWAPNAPPPRAAFPPRPAAQQPTTATPTTTPQTAAPLRPSITFAPPQTTPQTAGTQTPSQPSTTTNSSLTTITTRPTPTTTPQSAKIQNPVQLTTATTTPIPTAERPPFRFPGETSPQGPPPQSQTSRTESQPSSPSRATTQPQVPSQPESPSCAATQSRAPSSLHLHLMQLLNHELSPSFLASSPAGQTSSPPPPPSTTNQQEPTTAAVTQPTSSPETEQSRNEKNSQSSANSTEVVSPPSDKQEPKSGVSVSPFPEPHPKPDVVNDSQDRAPFETSIQPNEMTQQHSNDSGMTGAKVITTTDGPETPAVTQISNTTSNLNGKFELFPKELKTEETKEAKEVMQDNENNAQDGIRHKDPDFTGKQGRRLQTKDLPSIPFQSKAAQKPRNKTMVVDTHRKLANSNGEHIPLHKEIRDDISKLINKMAVGDSKHSIDGRKVSVITLAGENSGASMHVSSESSRRVGAVHIHRGYEMNLDDSAEATTDGEESFKGNSNNPKTKDDQASEAYVNSNVQRTINSIIFNSSITVRNPGVHLIHSNFPTESKKPSRKPEVLETRRAEFNMNPSQKLTYEPTVNRRCLRGLFLDSSDSDLDNTKP
ncbi:hypothetical protein ACH5RR_027378 [Cinchona calisaya]|uniref:Uncharacterized protein n=1 Tax=Cinchona calisaya TaxID=153742 RepID=A0ABD2Z754_9GENT